MPQPRLPEPSATPGKRSANGTTELPALAYVQLLGAPVQLSSQGSRGSRAPDLPQHPGWLDDETLLLDPDPAPDARLHVPRPLIGSRVVALAVPVAVVGMVGAVAVTLLTGHGPKFDQLTSHQANQPPPAGPPAGPLTGHGLTTVTFPTYPGLSQRGVFESVNRVVAYGRTIVATAQQTGAGVTRQLFYVSTDGGASWQLAAAPGNPPPGHLAPLLAGGPGGWVAIGPQAIWTSTDGTSWTLAATHGVSQLPGDQIWVVTKTAAGFLAGGSDAGGEGVVWTSPDGVTWHRQAMGPHVLNIAFATARRNDILIAGLLAAGGSGAWLSTDGGTSWTRVAIPPGHGATIAGVAWDAEGLLIVRDDAKAYFSNNGIAFHPTAIIGGTDGLRPRVVKGDANGLVVAGQTLAGRLVAYLSTDNGATWRPTATLGNAAAESVVGAAVAPGDHVIAIGATAANPVSQQAVFLDASAGTVRAIALPGANIPQLFVNALAEAGGTQIAVGGADGYPAIWRQSGETWSLVTQVGQFGTQGLAALTAVTHGPSGWLAVGSGLILTSPDGVTWRAAGGTAALAAADLLAAAAGPGAPGASAAPGTHAGYVIVGQQAWFSADLKTWTQASGLGGGEMLAVTATSRGFVAVGAVTSSANGQPAVWTSPDGRAWTRAAPATPAGAVLRQVAASGNRVVATGATAAGAPLAELSTDGGFTWRQVALGSAAPGTVITALTASPAGFTAAGISGAAGDQRIVAWTSHDGAVWTRILVGDHGGTRRITALAASGSAITGVGQIGTPRAELTVLWSSH